MHLPPQNRPRRARLRNDDRGAAMVEFSFIAVLLVLLVVGIINFGLLLSFKQDVTRAATEGARVAAVALPPAATPAAQTSDSRYIAGVAGTNDAVDSFNKTCGVDGMDCSVIIHNCDAAPVAGTVAYYDDGLDDCITVELTYDYANFPIVVEPPILGSALPDTISAKSVARLNE